uniref:Uncharacterized protein n=1 Tax=Romanomermis culicivorax TaxID=13658 RepID=A0A915J6E9_ROMCU
MKEKFIIRVSESSIILNRSLNETSRHRSFQNKGNTTSPKLCDARRLCDESSATEITDDKRLSTEISSLSNITLVVCCVKMPLDDAELSKAIEVFADAVGTIFGAGKRGIRLDLAALVVGNSFCKISTMALVDGRLTIF